MLTSTVGKHQVHMQDLVLGFLPPEPQQFLFRSHHDVLSCWSIEPLVP